MLRVWPSATTGLSTISASLALLGCGATPSPPAKEAPSSATSQRETVAPAGSADPAAPAVGAAAGQTPAERVHPALAPVLADGFEQRLSQRVKAAREAAARVRLDAPRPEPSKTRSDIMEYAVAAAVQGAAAAARVVLDTKTLRVAVWFDHAELETVATARVAFTSSKTSAPPERGMFARPGLRLNVRSQEAPRAEVEATYEFPSPDSGVITIGGWLDRTKIGFIYTPEAVPEPSATKGEPFFVARETGVLSMPGGANLAQVVTGGQGVFFPVTVVARHRGYSEIFLRTAELELRGFVQSGVLEELEPETHRGWGRGHFNRGLWQRWPKEQVQIAAGACIYDAPGGEAIGVFKLAHIENVVIEDKASEYRAYRLPHGAIGYVHSTDLERHATNHAPLAKGSMTIAADTWTCAAH